MATVRFKTKRFYWLIGVINKNRFRIGAEIGCASGRTTGTLLRECRYLKLYAVDLWAKVPEEYLGDTHYQDWNFTQVWDNFQKAVHPYRHRLTVLRGLSWEMAKKVKNDSLDFVFIDASHDKESAKKDILAWTPKLRPGGMMSGHDIHFSGVLEAINELIPNWKEAGVDHCWFCKKEDVQIV